MPSPKLLPPQQTRKQNASFPFPEPIATPEVVAQRRRTRTLELRAAEAADPQKPKFSLYDGHVPLDDFEPRQVAKRVADLVDDRTFVLTTNLHLSEITRETSIPPTCGLLVTPGVLSHPYTPGARLDELFRAEAQRWEGPRVANLADAIWILDDIDKHLVENATFFAPLRGPHRHRGEDPAKPEPIPVYILTRRLNGRRVRWDVRPAQPRASSYKGDFPVLRMAYVPKASPDNAD